MVETISTEQPPNSITDNDANVPEDRIAKLFSGKVLFITGSTGFLGKVLLEKFLRLCPDIDKIYVLIREKKGVPILERLKDTLSNVLFDLVKKERGEEAILKQVIPIRGDVSLPDLGMSQEDRKLLADEAQIVYHCAATVRFDEELRQAILCNTRGTKLMLNFMREFKQLKYFAYVSTAYCHLHVPHLMEKPYDPPADPEEMIRICEALDNDTVNCLKKQLLGHYPNAYAFTKALSEDLVVKTFDELPTFIHRPSIVTPIWKEPLPGWSDSINGPTGLLIAAGKGVLRSMYCNIDAYTDILPVDLAVNGMLITTWNTLSTNDFTQRVTHMTSSNELKVSWKEVIYHGRWIIENRLPLNGIAWYPGGSPTRSQLYHKFCLLFFMWLPAVLADCLLWCLRFPPILCRVQRRLGKGIEVLEFYANNQWSFDNSTAVKCRKKINDTERYKYVIEKIEVDAVKYFESCILATRRYILKTPDSLIPVAKRNMKIMWCLDKTMKYSFCIWFLYFVYCKIIYPYTPHAV